MARYLDCCWWRTANSIYRRRDVCDRDAARRTWRVVEYGTRAKPHQVLIEAGTFHSWPDVRRRLVARRKDRYELFVVTHVDEDHIGGSIKLLDDQDLRHRVSEVWFNGFVHLEQVQKPDGVLGPVQGEQLTDRLVRNSLGLDTAFTPGITSEIGGSVVVPDTGPLPSIDLPGGARIVVLSPTWPKLERMRKKWKKDVEKAGLVPGAGDAGLNIAPSPWARPDDDLPDAISVAAMNELAAKNKRDGSEANGSSIAFVIEFGGKRALLTGDAHSTVLAEGLKRYAAEIGEARPHLDLIKLAHHGSAGNLSSKLLESMTCDRFLISTNSDSFGHPDDEALARLIVECDQPTIYCNCKSERIDRWPDRAEPFGASFVFPKPGKTGLRVTV